MPSAIIQRINRDHAANQVQAAKRIVPTSNRVINRISNDHVAAQRSSK